MPRRTTRLRRQARQDIASMDELLGAQWVCLPLMGLSPLAPEPHEGKKVRSIVVYCLVVAPPPLALSLLSSSFRFCSSLCSAPLLFSLHRGCRRVILKKNRSKIRQADRMKDISKIRQAGRCVFVLYSKVDEQSPVEKQNTVEKQSTAEQ